MSSQPRTLTAAHYRPATSNNHCATCAYYANGKCAMFTGDPKVNPVYVCDKWTNTR